MSDRIEIVFMRHGRSLADDEEKFEGRYDSPLTEVGLAQARARAQEFRQAGERFDRIIASPLRRAHRTAQEMAEALGAPLELDPDWMEVDNGPLAGLTYAEGRERFPRPAFRGPFEAIAGGGESEIEMQARAGRALQKIVRYGPGRTLVVAHGGILNAALRVICAAPVPVNDSGVWFVWGDLGYCRVAYQPERNAWLIRELIS